MYECLIIFFRSNRDAIICCNFTFYSPCWINTDFIRSQPTHAFLFFPSSRGVLKYLSLISWQAKISMNSGSFVYLVAKVPPSLPSLLATMSKKLHTKCSTLASQGFPHHFPSLFSPASSSFNLECSASFSSASALHC